MKNVASREKSIARKGQRKKEIKNKNNKVRSHTVHTTRTPPQQTTQEIMQAGKYDTSSQSCLCLK